MQKKVKCVFAVILSFLFVFEVSISLIKFDVYAASGEAVSWYAESNEVYLIPDDIGSGPFYIYKSSDGHFDYMPLTEKILPTILLQIGIAMEAPLYNKMIVSLLGMVAGDSAIIGGARRCVDYGEGYIPRGSAASA